MEFLTKLRKTRKIICISERGCFGDGDPGMVDEAGHPLVSIKEAATIVKDYR